jgi:hypothetical protein
MSLEYMAAADERVFGPPDGPRQGRSWDYEGLLITCWGCGVSWHGTGKEKCWGCKRTRLDRLGGAP